MRTPALSVLVTVLALSLALLGWAGTARADVLELVDGRFVEGAVEKTAEGYRVRSRFGEATVPLADVKTWTQAKPVDAQIRERLAELKADDAENRAILAKWLADLGRDEEARALAEAVLEIDPESAAAHEVLGHVRHQGVWRTPDEAKKAEGLERHGDRWYTPQEWKNLGEKEREQVALQEKAALSKRVATDVSEAVRLMLSPDPLVSARGRSRLEALGAETGSERIRELPRKVDEVIKAREAIEAAEMSPDHASVLGELRVTLSRLKRPIQVFETSLASGPITAAAPVKIQLPELEVIRVNTTIAMPASKKR
jgi:hypothetical protein